MTPEALLYHRRWRARKGMVKGEIPNLLGERVNVSVRSLQHYIDADSRPAMRVCRDAGVSDTYFYQIRARQKDGVASVNLRALESICSTLGISTWEVEV